MPASPAPVRLLLVEDMIGDARLVELALSEGEAGAYQLDHRESLADLAAALHLAEAHKGEESPPQTAYDLLLLDLSLPDSHGLETVRRAMALLDQHGYGELPVVVLTGLDDPRMGLAAIQEGAQDYIIKGEFNHHLLQRIIGYAIERKAAARRHARLLERHAMILDSLGEGVIEVDRRGRVRHLNPAAAELLCLPHPADKVGGRFVDLLNTSQGSQDQLQALRVLEETLSEGQRRELFGVSLRLNDAGAVDVDLVLTPLRQEGQISGAVVALRDLRGRNDAYQALASHLAYERQLLDMLEEAVVVVDMQGVILNSNPAFCQMVGDAEMALLGAVLTDILPPPLEDHPLLDPNTAEEGTPEHGDTILSRRLWHSFDGTPGGAVFTFSSRRMG